MSFEPTAPDVFQGQLQIQSDDPDYPVIEIPILGRGVAAILRVEAETYTFEARWLHKVHKRTSATTRPRLTPH